MENTTQKDKSNVLVVGARGGFGGAVMRHLVEKGNYNVRALVRPGGEDISCPSVRVVEGDALCREDLWRATEGVNTIIYGLNVPYEKWEDTLVPAARVLAEVAALRGARIVYPGNVYGFDPNRGHCIDEQTLPNAPTRKGEIRNEIEEILKHSTLQGSRLLIVRAGDFFGPLADNTWFSFMTSRAKTGRTLLSPTKGNELHAWAYLPDLAETVGRLLDRGDELESCEIFHFAGHHVTCTELLEECSLALGSRKVRAIPWRLLSMLGILMPSMREISEMRYLWENELVLDESKLVRFLERVPHAPLSEAVCASLSLQPVVNVHHAA